MRSPSPQATIIDCNLPDGLCKPGAAFFLSYANGTPNAQASVLHSGNAEGPDTCSAQISGPSVFGSRFKEAKRFRL